MFRLNSYFGVAHHAKFVRGANPRPNEPQLSAWRAAFWIKHHDLLLITPNSRRTFPRPSAALSGLSARVISVRAAAKRKIALSVTPRHAAFVYIKISPLRALPRVINPQDARLKTFVVFN